MKKLFTLLALLTCFLGAKADVLVDKEVDFTKLESIDQMQWYSWGGQGREKFDLDEGCLHFQQDAHTDNPWGVQVFPIGGVDVSAGKTYYLEVKIKGTGSQYRTKKEGEGDDAVEVYDPGTCIHNICLQGAGNIDKYDCIEVTEDFSIATVEYTPEQDGTANFLFQCGSWEGELWIEYMKVWHEGKLPKPRVWENILTNGDAEGDYGDVACAWSKEWGENLGDDGKPTPHAAPIVELDGNKVFLSHHIPVDPPILWDSDGSQWGVDHKAGDPMGDNAWQNQFWICLPEPVKEGTQLQVKFKYKASIEANADIQTHAAPGDYIGGFTPGSIHFTTEWQPFEAEFSAPAPNGDRPNDNFQSIAFNLGKFDFAKGDLQYEKDINFYFDDLEISTLVLEHGYFAAATDTEDGNPEYDYDNAVEFVYDEAEAAYFATVGTEGDEDSWVNEVMISTVRGDEKAFKGATLKPEHSPKNDPNDLIGYAETASAKISLPVHGVWKIMVDPDQFFMSFEKLEGEEDLVEIEINPNKTEIVVDGQARTTNTWDNQFFIVAERELNAGEETWLEFDYWLESDDVDEAKVTTQFQGEPSDWAANGATADLTFSTANNASEPQHFAGTVTIPSNKTQKGLPIKSIAFNMAEVEQAAKYYITNVVWKLSNNTESLIKQEGATNFWMSEGAGPLHQFGEEVVVPGKRGNLNPDKDDKVNGTDVQILINFIVNEEDYDEFYDLKTDGKVNGTDIQELINIIVNEEE